MSLVIIESPNKIKKLKKILGSNYEVVATVGHFMKLSKKDLGFDKDKFDPKYETDSKKKDVVKNIKDVAKKHDVIYIATDPDREGEAIGKHIQDLLPKNGKKIYRVKFNAITKEAVKKAMKNPGVIDENLYLAQTARRLTDRIVGYKISPVMWKKGLAKTSAGRVQSVALKIISDREKQVVSFVPQEYWSISFDFLEGFSALLEKINDEKIDIKNKKEAEDIIKKLNSSTSIKISKYTAKSSFTKPKPPFTTSTMQQDASNAFGWSSKKTMNVAQNIFGAGLITYHRTDSVRSDDLKIDDLRTSIESQYTKAYLSPSKILYSNKDASQDAHEAIRPTYENPPPNLSSDDKKLLKLIQNRFCASQMKDAKYDRVSVLIEVISGKDKFIFSAKGSTLVFDGFLKVYGNKTIDVSLPLLKQGQVLSKKSIDKKQHFTQAPPRYSDASLVKKLEKDGVGRPSTYATIIETLVDRKYINRKNKTLVASETGIMISDYLSDKFSDITSVEFTSNMEKALDEISDGKKEYVPIMKSFWKSIESAIDIAMKQGLPDTFITDFDCPKCKSKMIKKISNFGPFLACTSWPKCDGTLKIDGESNDVEVETGDACPNCSNILVKRKGSNGNFWGCKSFPVCKFTKSENEESDNKEGLNEENEKINCDKCGEGNMIKRKGKYGFFLGCNAYPKCKNIKKI